MKDNAFQRRRDIESMLLSGKKLTTSFDYPVYTKPDEGGGGFITENYKPYTNTLTH